jgi:hypothetical protein
MKRILVHWADEPPGISKRRGDRGCIHVVCGKWFFDQCVYARSGQVHGDSLVRSGRGADVRHIDWHSIKGRHRPCIAKVSGKLLCCRLPCIHDRDDEGTTGARCKGVMSPH